MTDGLYDNVKEKRIDLADNGQAVHVLGQQDAHLRAVEKTLPVKITARGGSLLIRGESQAVEEAANILNHLKALAEGGIQITPLAVNYAIASRAIPQENLTGRLAETSLW